MSNQTIAALHRVHTATNDVLKGYREMSARAQPDIQTVIDRLIDVHERHAREQAAELVRLGDSTKEDSSLQGSVNKAVVILRDWVTDLDRDALPAVRSGEQSLRDKYEKALDEGQLTAYPPVAALLKTQLSLLNDEIARLPEK